MIAVRALGRVALTGAPGWLGNALLEVLRPELGVTTVDVLGHPSAWSEQDRPFHSRVTRYRHYDLRQAKPELRSMLDGIETVVHAAGVIHVRKTQDWYDINTKGTIRLAQEARSAGVRRFVFVSSNAVGGRCRSVNHTLSESDAPMPMSHYGRSKLLAEQGLLLLHKPNQFEIVILRPSMFYGPPVPPRHIDVYRRIQNGRFPVIGTGLYRRSLTYIDHLVQAVMLASTRFEAAGQTYYVVDDRIYTTLEICEAMAEALNVPFRKLWLPTATGPIAYAMDRILASAGIYWQTLHLVGESDWHVAISSEKLKRELGYSPSIDLREGMRRAVAWCRENGSL